MRRLMLAWAAMVSTGCAGILGLDEFTDGESGSTGGGSPTGTTESGPTTSQGGSSPSSTSSGDGGAGQGGTGDGGAGQGGAGQGGGGGTGGGVVDPLDVSPEGNVKVGILRAQQFTANVAVTWSVEAGGGTIDEDGFYIAPDEPGTYELTATSVADASDVVTVSIVAAPLGIDLVGGIPGGPGTLDGPVSKARLNTPHGMAMVQNGSRMLIADSNSMTIRVWDRSPNTLGTLAGVPFAVGTADGTGAAARFNQPTDIVANENGSEAWIVDGEGTCIRHVVPATGQVATIAGSCGLGGSTDANAGADVRFRDIESMVMGPNRDRLYVCQYGGGTPSMRRVDLGTGATTTLTAAAVGQLGSNCRMATDFYRQRLYFTSNTSEEMIKSLEETTATTITVTDLVALPAAVNYAYELITMTGYGNSDDIYVYYYDAIWHYRIGQPTFDAEPFLGGDGEYGYVDGDLAQARFTTIDAMFAYPQQGDFYFVDRGGRTVRRVDPDDDMATVVGRQANVEPIDGPKAVGRLPNPFPIALDEDGNIYTSGLGEGDDNVIRKIDGATGEISTFSGIRDFDFDLGPLDGPADQATFSAVYDMVRIGDALYVADIFGSTIRRVSLADGSVETIAGTSATPGFADGIGTQAQFRFIGEDSGGAGLATDGVDLYVADGGNFAIRKLEIATTEVTTLAGGTQGTNNGVGDEAQFLTPFGLAVDRGVLFIVDAEDNVIRRLDLDTLEVTTLIGLSGVAGYTDGDASVATFQQPLRIAADGLGNLYVTGDLGSEGGLGAGVIRRIDIDDLVVSTHAGTAGVRGFSTGPIPSTLGCAGAVAVTPEWNLRFTDFCDGAIGEINPL